MVKNIINSGNIIQHSKQVCVFADALIARTKNGLGKAFSDLTES